MKFIKLLSIAILWCGSLSVFAQQPRAVMVSLFTNSTALPTRPALFRPIHPGLMAGTAFRYNKSETNPLSQTLKLGVFYHRQVQTDVQLYSEFSYGHFFKNGLDLDAMLGGGYVHSFPDTHIFKLNSDGRYERITNWGKPEVMGTASIGAGYTLNLKRTAMTRLFLIYQFWLQTPFVNQYVPVLPNTALHVGISKTIFSPSGTPIF